MPKRSAIEAACKAARRVAAEALTHLCGGGVVKHRGISCAIRRRGNRRDPPHSRAPSWCVAAPRLRLCAVWLRRRSGVAPGTQPAASNRACASSRRRVAHARALRARRGRSACRSGLRASSARAPRVHPFAFLPVFRAPTLSRPYLSCFASTGGHAQPWRSVREARPQCGRGAGVSGPFGGL